MLKLGYGLKHALDYSNKEINAFLLTTVIAGFLLSARNWGTPFSIAVGIGNFFTFSLIFGVLFFLFVTMQKFIAYALGCKGTYKIWRFGPFIAFLISLYLIMFIPNSNYYFLVVLYIGSVNLEVIPEAKLGKFRQGLNISDMVYVGMTGPATIILLILLILQPIYLSTHSQFSQILIIIASLILFYSSLPLPKMNGLNILIRSRVGWLFYFFFSLLFLVLILTLNFWTYLVALALAILLVWAAKKYLSPKLHG